MPVIAGGRGQPRDPVRVISGEPRQRPNRRSRGCRPAPHRPGRPRALRALHRLDPVPGDARATLDAFAGPRGYPTGILDRPRPRTSLAHPRRVGRTCPSKARAASGRPDSRRRGQGSVGLAQRRARPARRHPVLRSAHRGPGRRRPVAPRPCCTCCRTSRPKTITTSSTPKILTPAFWRPTSGTSGGAGTEKPSPRQRLAPGPAEVLTDERLRRTDRSAAPQSPAGCYVSSAPTAGRAAVVCKPMNSPSRDRPVRCGARKSSRSTQRAPSQISDRRRLHCAWNRGGRRRCPVRPSRSPADPESCDDQSPVVGFCGPLIRRNLAHSQHTRHCSGQSCQPANGARHGARPRSSLPYRRPGVVAVGRKPAGD